MGARLNLEELGSRVVPATFTWTYQGTGSGLWNEAIYWDRLQVPTTTDHIVIPYGTGSITMGLGQIASLTIADNWSGTFTVTPTHFQVNGRAEVYDTTFRFPGTLAFYGQTANDFTDVAFLQNSDTPAQGEDPPTDVAQYVKFGWDSQSTTYLVGSISFDVNYVQNYGYLAIGDNPYYDDNNLIDARTLSTNWNLLQNYYQIDSYDDFACELELWNYATTYLFNNPNNDTLQGSFTRPVHNYGDFAVGGDIVITLSGETAVGSITANRMANANLYNHNWSSGPGWSGRVFVGTTAELVVTDGLYSGTGGTSVASYGDEMGGTEAKITGDVYMDNGSLTLDYDGGTGEMAWRGDGKATNSFKIDGDLWIDDCHLWFNFDFGWNNGAGRSNNLVVTDQIHFIGTGSNVFHFNTITSVPNHNATWMVIDAWDGFDKVGGDFFNANSAEEFDAWNESASGDHDYINVVMNHF